ncbi:putative tail assembly protein [Escherichia coli DEC4A]|nr:putative tail assembly protein [Escherichia coli DEC4A]
MNISAEPEAYFRIAPEDWLQAEMQGRLWRWFTATLVVCPG